MGFAIFIPENVIKGFGLSGYILKVSALSVLLYSVGLLLSLKMWGLIGTATALVGSQIVLKVVLVNKARELLGLSGRSCLPWREVGILVVVCILSAIPMIMVKLWMKENSALTLGIKWCVFSLVYGTTILFTPVLSSEEKNSLWLFVKMVAQGLWFRRVVKV
jgi:hypothetical protein